VSPIWSRIVPPPRDKALAREWFGTVEEVIYDSEQQWVLELAKKQAELNEHFLN